MTPKRQPHHRSLSPAKLDEMIAEATVDAYGEEEQTAGFFTMFEERLKLPFKTESPCAHAANRSSAFRSWI